MRGEVTRPPTEYIDLILVPNILHTPVAVFHEQPHIIQERTRRLLLTFIAAGWAGNVNLVKREDYAE